MKNILFYLFAFCISGVFSPAFSQEKENTEMDQSTKDRMSINDKGITPNTVMFGFDSRPREVLGDYYLDINWCDCKVVFYPATKPGKMDTIVGIPSRYDIKNNEMEFKSEYGIKATTGTGVKYFEHSAVKKATKLKVTRFVNAKEFRGKADGGFYEVFSEGKLTFLAQDKIWIKQPTYNAALDVGSRDTEIKKVRTYYVYRGGKMSKMKLNKGAALGWMKSKKSQVEQFIGQEKIDCESPVGLARVFDFYNGLE